MSVRIDDETWGKLDPKAGSITAAQRKKTALTASASILIAVLIIFGVRSGLISPQIETDADGSCSNSDMNSFVLYVSVNNYGMSSATVSTDIQPTAGLENDSKQASDILKECGTSQEGGITHDTEFESNQWMTIEPNESIVIPAYYHVVNCDTAISSINQLEVTAKTWWGTKNFTTHDPYVVSGTTSNENIGESMTVSAVRSACGEYLR